MSAIEQIIPYAPRQIVLDLPFPPSLNSIWRRGKHKGMYLSPAYRAWKRTADATCIAKRIFQRLHIITVPFEATILLNADAGQGDVDNRIKCLLDYAQRIEIIKNDKLCRKVTAEWVTPSRAPFGCRLILQELAG